MTSSVFDPAIDNLVIATRKEIVFIEDNVADYQTIAANAGAGRQVVILDSTKDGLQQIADAVKDMRGIDALHIVTHGAEGKIVLGALTLDQAAAAQHQDVLATIGASMTSGGDMLFYGCSVGAGQGAGLLSQLAIATGADVAASNDATGDASLGGDWNLEVSTGSIETAPFVDAALASQYHALLNIPGSVTLDFQNLPNSGGYGANKDIADPLPGQPGYTLNFDGHQDAVWSYSAFSNTYLSFSPTFMEDKVTIAFSGGQKFTPTSVKVNGNASADQTLLFTGLRADNTEVTHASIDVVAGASINDFVLKNLSGFTNITKLVITAQSGGIVQYFQMDDLVISNIHPAVPTLTITSNKSVLTGGDTATITFTFSDDPGASFTAADIAVSGGTLSGLSTTGMVRTATFTPTAGVNSGSASISVSAGAYADAGGQTNTAASSGPSITYDTLAPGAPSTPVLAAADDKGASSSDGITNKTTLLFSGTAEANATVKLYDSDGTTVVGSGSADGSGVWSFNATLTAGAHTINAKATDAAGNVSAASAGRSVVVDQTPPTTTVTGAALSSDTGASASDMITKIAGQTISGTLSANLAAGERVMVSLDNGATWSAATASAGANTWELAGVTLAGSNTLKVKVEDLAGNGGAVYSHAYVLDRVAPAATSMPDLDAGSDSGISNTDNITGVTLPSFSGTAEVGATVILFDGGIEIGSDVAEDGTWHITTSSTTPLNQRIHYITTDVVDLAGNHGPTSPVLELDVRTAGPATTVAGLALSFDSGAAGDFVTNQSIQAISGTLSANLATGERVEVSRDGGATWNNATSAVGSNTWSIFTTLLSGTHDIKVRVVDAVDNAGAVLAQAYTLDTVKPAVGIGSDVAQLKTGETATITFTFSEDPGTSFDDTDITVSGGTLSALSGSGLTRTAVFTPAANTNGGSGSISIDAGKYQDLAGNDGFAGSSSSLSFDTLAPAAASAPDLDAASDKGDSSTDKLTNLSSLTFKGTAEAGATVKLYDSDGSTEIGSGTATGGNWTIATATLGAGSHTVTAKVFDAAGNVSAASGATTVTIDTTAPTLVISSDASQLKIGETATITFTFSEDPGATFTWDGTAGDVTVSGGTLSAIQGTGTVRTATFTPTANTNGGAAVITVSAGSYRDAAGNDGAAGATPSLHFDTLAPAAPSTPALLFDNGLSNHDGVINLPSPVFTGSVEAGSTVTIYDADSGDVLGAGTASGGTWTILSTALSEGEHKVYAVARDAAGNASPASASATVVYDKTPPTVTVSSNVSTLKIGETALITFVFSEDPAGFFSLANLTNAAGTFSGLSGTGLTRTAVFTPNADHEGSVVDVGTGTLKDVAGNSSLGGSVPIFIDTRAPASPGAPRFAAGSDTGSSPTDGITNDATPSLRGFKEINSTVTLYDSDGTVLGTSSEASGAWTITTSALSDGVHTITAKETDSVGNISTVSAGLVVTIDTHVAAPAAPVLDPSSDSAAKGDSLTSDTTPTVTGSAEANASVTLYDSDGSTVLGTATADAGGAWSITSSVLSPGSHALTVRQVDVAGNASDASLALTLTIDDQALALAAPALATASDSGAPGDAITKTTTPSFSGSAEALAQVTLYDGAFVIGSVQAGADGAWQITAPALGDGVHAISARQVDRAGNVSGAGAVFSLTVDTVAPAAPAAPSLKASSDTGSIGDGVTENTIPVIEGTALADTLVTLYETVGGSKVKLGSTMADGSGKWSVATTGLSTGTHLLSATQTDAAGNESAASAGFSLRIAEPPIPIDVVDGMPVTVIPISLPGNVPGTSVSIPIVGTGRLESSGQPGVADIPLVKSGQGAPILLAQLPAGYGLSASGANLPAASAGDILIAAIKAATPGHTTNDQGHLTGNGQSFLAGLGASGSLLVETVKPVSSAAPAGVLTLSGPAPGAGQSTALVIDTGGLTAGATIALQQVNFAAVIGAANVTAGSGTILSGDGASQHFTVAAGGSASVFAGGGNDILSVAAAAATGPAPAAGVALLHGGAASDTATFSGARADYNIEYHNGYVMVSTKAAPDVKAMVVNVEQLQFSDASIAVQNSADMGTLAGIYQTVLGRQADVMGIEYWANVHQAGASWGAIALSMISSGEHAASHEGFNGVAAHDLALLYAAIFNREGDAGGMAYWSAELARGITLEQVASTFVESAEMVGHQRAATDWDFFVGR